MIKPCLENFNRFLGSFKPPGLDSEQLSSLCMDERDPREVLGALSGESGQRVQGGFR